MFSLRMPAALCSTASRSVLAWAVAKLPHPRGPQLCGFSSVANATTTFRIHRYDPEKGGRPRMQEYSLDTSTCGPMVLDALIAIKDKQESHIERVRGCVVSAAYGKQYQVLYLRFLCDEHRWYQLPRVSHTHQEEGAVNPQEPQNSWAPSKSSSCGLAHLGLPRELNIACQKHCENFAEGGTLGAALGAVEKSLEAQDQLRGPSTEEYHDHFEEDDESAPVDILPLPYTMVLKDLVPDLTNFYTQYKSIQPWLQRKTKPAEGSEILQSIEDREKLDGLYECILCACCSTSCPSYWWNPQSYLGPAVLMQAFRWISDSRDEFTRERLAQINDTMKLYRCHGIMNCSIACPKGLDPAGAIRKMKAQVEKEFGTDFVSLKAQAARARSAQLSKEVRAGF